MRDTIMIALAILAPASFVALTTPVAKESEKMTTCHINKANSCWSED